MDAGRELDARVAEKVMGWTREVSPYPERNGEIVWLPPLGTPERWDEDDLGPPHYSTDIAAAWEVLTKLAGEWKFYFRVDGTKPREWAEGCTFISARYIKITMLHFQTKHTIELEHQGLVSDMPHAICLAALKAVSAEVR